MKGTLFSADFVKDSSGGLRLIELNTDTAIQDSLAAGQLNWGDLISTLSSNSITELYVIYKNVQKSIVDNLEQALIASELTTSFNRIIESDNSIYPSVVEDGDTKFILRLAFDQSAIFDSEYAAKDLNVYKLFIDNSQGSKVPGIYYSGPESDSVIDTLENTTNPDNIADLAVRKIVSIKGDDLSFYKTGNTTYSDADRIAIAKTEIGASGQILTNYYVEHGSTRASSIRLYQIIFGNNLDIIHVGGYKIEAILDFPTSLDVDLTSNISKIPNKHYSEFSVEGINRVGGITADHSLVRHDGGSDIASETIVGDKYLSYFVNGAPDTDEYGSLFAWSYGGDNMPTGSFPTGATLISDSRHVNTNNAVIKITLDNGDVLRVGGITNIIIYQAATNSVRYIYASSLRPEDSLFNADGLKVGITSLDVEIIDQDGNFETFEYNLEDTDIFTVSGSNIIVHNAPCFIPGTLISTEDGNIEIEHVKVGDRVLAFNHKTNEVESKKVQAITVKENEEVVKIDVSEGETVICTLDHPFFTKDKGYASFNPVKTKELSDLDVVSLTVGDSILTVNGEYKEIISFEVLGNAPVVYNLSKIEGHSNFFANGMLVHNRYK